MVHDIVRHALTTWIQCVIVHPYDIPAACACDERAAVGGATCSDAWAGLGTAHDRRCLGACETREALTILRLWFLGNRQIWSVYRGVGPGGTLLVEPVGRCQCQNTHRTNTHARTHTHWGLP
jgi:hypothetical protein